MSDKRPNKKINKLPFVLVGCFIMLCVVAMYLAPESLGYGLPETKKEGSLMVPNALEGTEIEDKRGEKIDSNILLTRHDGQKVKLTDYFGADRKKPIIVTLGYFECPMLCNLVLNGLIDVAKKVKLKIGEDYDILTISINPNEEHGLAKSKRKNYLATMGIDESQKSWPFFAGDEVEVKKLAKSLGFGYKYDKKIEQYAHSAGFFVLSPQGVLSRTFYGIEFKPTQFKMSLIEASNGKIGSLMDRVILSCFHYDPDSHRYGVYIFGLMRIGGLAIVLILGIVLVFLWRNERFKKL